MTFITALFNFEQRLFTERHIRIFGAVLLAANVFFFGWALLNGKSAIAPQGGPSSIDFAQFYLGGAFAASANPASIYHYSAFAAAQAALFGSPQGGFPYFHFLYPPTFLVFTHLLWLMPFFVAFGAWLGGTFLLYEAAAYAIIPRASTLIAAAVPVTVLVNAQLGQNGFLTAGLIGLALVSTERRPILAGIFIGLLTYKPQFGVLFPLALLAGREWRVIASATATAAVLALTAALVLGHDVWQAYFASFGGFDARLSPDKQVECVCQSVFGILQRGGTDLAVAWTMHLIAAVLTAAAVCTVWLRPSPYPLKAAALCVGAVAVTPYVLLYDLCILTVAAAFLVQDGLTRGFRPGERILLLLCFVLSAFLARPIGPLLYAILLGHVAWRLLADRQEFSPIVPEIPGARRPRLLHDWAPEE